MTFISSIRCCAGCKKDFPIYEDDIRFYAGFDVPVPSLCFHCRLQRKMSHFNRRNLYWRSCDKSGERVLSVFSPDKPYPVYGRTAWYSDDWDPLSYGRDFDFTRPFFPQYYELSCAVPHLGLAVGGDLQNSDYVNDAAYLTNCYLLFDAARCRGTLYSESGENLTDSAEVLSSRDCELCYEIVSCTGCYNLKFSEFCGNCSSSWYLRDCVGCRDCFGCTNLRQKQYCYFNKQLSADEYLHELSKFDSTSYQECSKMRKQVDKFFSTQALRGSRVRFAEDSVGDRIERAQRAFLCFGGNEIQDCRYCTDLLLDAKDCSDVHGWGLDLVHAYESCTVGEHAHNILACNWVWSGVSNIEYSMTCFFDCHNLFGCYGLRHKKFCIFNTQYSKDEYQRLRSRIVSHMKETGEWGEYFPTKYSLFGYNETLAQVQFPLTRSDAIAKDWSWSDFEASPKVDRMIEATALPPRLVDFPAELLKAGIKCAVSGKLFRFTEAELELYGRLGVPLPIVHPNERHQLRVVRRGSLTLNSAKCGICDVDLLTTQIPSSSVAKQLRCEACYEREVA